MGDLIVSHRFQRPPAGVALLGPDNRQLTERELSALIGIYWPVRQAANALKVCLCESGGWTGAWATEGEDSRGLFQLNVDAHPALRDWNLFDPQINCYWAYDLWVAQGWGPWTCAHRLGIV